MGLGAAGAEMVDRYELEDVRSIQLPNSTVHAEGVVVSLEPFDCA